MFEYNTYAMFMIWDYFMNTNRTEISDLTMLSTFFNIEKQLVLQWKLAELNAFELVEFLSSSGKNIAFLKKSKYFWQISAQYRMLYYLDDILPTNQLEFIRNYYLHSLYKYRTTDLFPINDLFELYAFTGQKPWLRNLFNRFIQVILTNTTRDTVNTAIFQVNSQCTQSEARIKALDVIYYNNYNEKDYYVLYHSLLGMFLNSTTNKYRNENYLYFYAFNKTKIELLVNDELSLLTKLNSLTVRQLRLIGF